MNPSVTVAPEAALNTVVPSTRMEAMLQSGYGSFEVYRFGEAPRPKAGLGEVVIAVRAAGVDRGTWHMMTGRPYLMRLMGFGLRAPKSPVPGFEVAGTVVETGPSVTRFKIGDDVFGVAKGAFAQYAAASETKLAKKPAAITFEQAAAVGVSGSTALQALEAAKVERGMRVLVMGASGGVGSCAVQLAKARGGHVTGVASERKMDFVRAQGADVVVSYEKGFAEEKGRYDAILDIGGNTPLARLRRLLTPSGALVFVGGEAGGDWTAGFERQLLAALMGPFVKQRFLMLVSQERYEPLERLATFLEAGTLKPAVDRTFPLHALSDALRALVAGSVRGKLVLTIP
jgi:NADPH:quinone reductase-like Zn-dependent oxidoreductase